MRKSLLFVAIFIALLVVVATPRSEAQTTAFGINWKTATPADVAGIDANAEKEDGATPLHWAAWINENPAVIEALLKAGAKVNAEDENGWTPLQIAASSNKNPAIVEALLKAGAKVNAKNDDGWTPLRAAEFNKNPAVAEALRKAGAE